MGARRPPPARIPPCSASCATGSAAQLGQADAVVVKDPRTVWFLPLWMRCAAELGAAPAFVTMLRHPAETLASASASYGDLAERREPRRRVAQRDRSRRSAPRAARGARSSATRICSPTGGARSPDRRADRVADTAPTSSGRGCRRSTSSSIRRCTATAWAGTRSTCRRVCATWPRTSGGGSSRWRARRRLAGVARRARRGAGRVTRTLQGGGGHRAVLDHSREAAWSAQGRGAGGAAAADSRRAPGAREVPPAAAPCGAAAAARMVNRRRRAGRAAVALVERVKRWVLRRRHVMSLYRRVRGGGDSRLEGDDSLPIGPPGATLTGVRWTESGTLELAGERRAAADVAEVVVRGRSTLREHAFRTTDGGEPGHFTAELDVARIESLGGALPLREDTYDLCLRPTAAANARRGSVALAERVLQALPLERVVDHKPLALGMTRSGRAVLKVGRDLDDDERGPRQQRRLRETVYLARRREPLSDAVVYSSFRGRQYSDNPRAVHEELLRRAAPLEHLWVVRDAQCRVPETATVVRGGQPRSLRGAGQGSLRRLQRPLLRVVREEARPGLAPDLARHAAETTGLRRLADAKRGSSLRARLARAGPELAVRTLPQPVHHADPPPRVRHRRGDPRDRLPPRTTCWQGRTATSSAGSCGGGSAFPRMSVSCSTPPPTGTGSATAEGATGSTSNSTSTCSDERWEGRGRAVPQAPLHRRSRAGDRGRLRPGRVQLPGRRPS